VAPDTMQQTEAVEDRLNANMAAIADAIDKRNGPKPPEYWTEENTAKWQAEVWGNPEGRSAAMVEWSRPYDGIYLAPPPRSRAVLCAVIPAETMAQWRLNDPRPSATHYYDGTPITHYQPLRVKKPRARKVAAA
jgi:hypothetical protein